MKTIFLTGATLLALTLCARAETGDISTVVGTGAGGFSGDSGPAISAQIRTPWDVAFDWSGNMYIADGSNRRVRKVDANGIITTFAGTGAFGGTGDGGPATSATFRIPRGVAVDSSGNVYIVDRDHNRVRKVGTNGIITTVAGGGSSLGDGGPATNARLISPLSVDIDAAGNLYITDRGHSRIRKVDINGMITTVAGNGSVGFGGDEGPATNAYLNGIRDAIVDDAGNLYIADTNNHRIRKVGTNGTITTIAGNGLLGHSGDGGLATDASFHLPTRLAFDSAGALYVCDSRHVVRKIDTSGIITRVAGTGAVAGFSGDGGLAEKALLLFPFGIDFDPAGNLHIADRSNNRIRMVEGRPTPEDLIEPLTEDVEELLIGGILNGGQTNSLVSKLDNILKMLEKGQTQPAINQLGAFINQVLSLVDEGVLTPDEGQDLVDAALDIIDQLTE